MRWPTGPWIIWVTADGKLLVTERGQPQPERTAFPVAGADSRKQAGAMRLLLGHRPAGSADVVVDSFNGRICDVIELQVLLAQRSPSGAA
jgi:hypothetical protein